MAEQAIGVVGLATMGMNLARNLASHGASVAVYNRTRTRTDEFMSAYAGDGDFRPAFTLEELTKALRPPRAILIMVKAGAPVDEAIDALSLILKPGDTLIDGGNSLFHDTRRRAAVAAQRGLGFLGMGVSGGEEGALRGPSLMPGGPRESYDRVEELLKAISAKVDGVPCCAYIGPDGAGHFVKMVHNGIEYADIQLIAESYDFLREALGLDANELAAIFREWNEGELQSYLIEITANVLAKRDDGAGAALVDQIEDEAEQKGTGRWTSQSALELGVPLTGITEAVFARMLSSHKRERVTASSILAARREARCRSRRADPGIRVVPGVLRRLSPSARTSQPHPGAARLLRLACLSRHRSRGRVSHALGAGRRRGQDRPDLIGSVGFCPKTRKSTTRARARAGSPQSVTNVSEKAMRATAEQRTYTPPSTIASRNLRAA